MKKVKISQVLCGLLIAHTALDDEGKTEFDRDNTRFNYWVLEEGHDLRKMVEAETGLQVETLRVHEFEPGHKALPHVDNIHPGSDSMIMRLDTYGPSRLEVEGGIIAEIQGEAIILPEGTVHSIITGEHSRYTLVGWVKSEKITLTKKQAAKIFEEWSARHQGSIESVEKESTKEYGELCADELFKRHAELTG